MSQRFHFGKKLGSGERAKFVYAAMITTADYGLSSPTGASIGPPAMTDESRILTQRDNFIASKVMQVFHRAADAGDLPVDRFNRPIVEVVVSGDKVERAWRAYRRKFPEVADQERCRRDVASDDRGVAFEFGYFSE